MVWVAIGPQTIQDRGVLRHHGDAELAPGLVDLAVNVRTGPPPRWLADALLASLGELAPYPDQTRARSAVAAHHARAVDDVLLTAGAAEAFVLLARALRPRSAVVVNPQFTEPEAALLHAGHRVERVILAEPFALDPAVVPAAADLVVIGNPTNPTSVAHPPSTLAALARPGRTLVVDEAFIDTLPDGWSLADRTDLSGLVVVRSLTKTWGLAGLRVGYLLASPDLVRELAAAAPLWPVSTPALAAIEACLSPAALADLARYPASLAGDREHLVAGLRALPGVTVPGAPASSFVPVRLAGADAARLALRDRGYAVRRGDTFPGLGPDWLRIAVRDRATSDAFLAALADVLAGAI
jgi:histidinol-phosphate aminotransferase